MNKKLISLAIAGAVATPFAAQAGSFTVGNQDIKVSGGITGAYIYSSENTAGKQDVFAVPDALLDFSSEAKTGGMGFDLGIGTLGENSLASGGAVTPIGTFSVNLVQYAFASVKPIAGLEVDAGILPTNVGYEVSPTYDNANMLLGLVWNAQPTYYTGARATYTTNGISVYAEASKDPLGTDNPGGAVGASGDFGGIHGAISYYTRVDDKKIIDLIATGKVGSIAVGANLDYITLADSAKNARVNANGGTSVDDTAIGIALYASVMPMDKVTLPFRVEYVDDGSSGIYTGNTVNATTGKFDTNSAITFTVTPTYNFTDSTFVRGELAYVVADKKGPYVDDNGAPDDTAWVVGAQGGVRF